MDDKILDDIINRIDSLRIEDCESGSIVRKADVSDFKRPSLIPSLIVMRSLLADRNKA